MMKYLVTVIRILFLALFLFLLVNGKAMLWLGLFALSLIAALFFGRVYCGYVCPMNTVMIPAEWVSKKCKIQTERTPAWLKNGYFSLIALILSIAAMLIGKRVLHMDIPVLPIWLIIAVLVTVRYKPAVFHNLICPFGALQKVTGRYARAAQKVDTGACIGCRLCEKNCPSDAIKVIGNKQKADINTALCHQCMNCQLVCPGNAIIFGLKKRNIKTEKSDNIHV